MSYRKLSHNRYQVIEDDSFIGTVIREDFVRYPNGYGGVKTQGSFWAAFKPGLSKIKGGPFLTRQAAAEALKV